MATISSKKLPQALDAFFRDQLQPVGARLKQRGPLFPLRADRAAASYYAPRPKARMDRADFERLGPLSTATLAADLSRLWSEAGTPELAPLAPALADLAAAAAEVEKEQEGDVSPFVYAMY
jgi:hypothetical protein